MRRPLLLGLALVCGLGACGSRLNPLNWFHPSTEAEPTLAFDTTVEKTDSRPLMAKVISLQVEPLKGGALVHAVGLPPTQGYWNAELVARPVEDGRITYDFHAVAPAAGTPGPTQQSREVTVAAFITAFKLQGIREIGVVAAENALSSRR